MLFQAHRGVSTEYPENTMPAFEAAWTQGYQIIETDPLFTVDGECVLFHDHTPCRTCRKPNGEPITEQIRVRDMTWQELSVLDAGMYMGEQFRGIRVPLLAPMLSFAAEKNIHVKLDNKFESFTPEQKEKLFQIVENSGADVGFSCAHEENVRLVTERFPKATIHYDGYVDEEKIASVKALLKENPLVIWLALPSRLTSWVEVPTASPQLCQMVKKYGKLGLWILETEEQLEKAEALGADIIETTGSVKPR